MAGPSYHDIAKMLDHSLLRPGTTDQEFEEGIDEALQLGVASVCIQPHYLPRLVQRLAGSDIYSSTVIGFPHGSHSPRVKLEEAKEAIESGCQELDVVVNTGKVRSGEYGFIRDEMGAIVSVAHRASRKVKVIFENALLADDQKIRLCEICGEIDADWAKTSTGFATVGATVPDVQLMREHCPTHVEVKASGGIRTLAQLLALREAGATRIGLSQSRPILEELE